MSIVIKSRFKCLLFCLFVASCLNAQVIDFPDQAFKNDLIAAGFDLNDNQEIELDEALLVEEIDLSNKTFPDITTIEGIEFFTNLKTLIIPRRDITTNIDLRDLTLLNTIVLSDNNFAEILLPETTTLTELTLSRTDINTLEVGALTSLKVLHATGVNPTGLNNCNLLEDLYLTELDIKENPLDNFLELRDLSVANISSSYVDFSPLVKLKELIINGNELLNINIKSCIDLEVLSVYSSLFALDINEVV